MAQRLFTSESVTEGHPDKLADQISDAVLDALLKDDPYSRVAVETFAITGQIHIAGEVTTRTYVDIPRIAREVVREVGYTRSAIGFDAETCGVSVSIDEQSPDIALGVDRSLEARAGDDDEFERIGAGDQGMMFGYACRETEELMPLPIVLAHNLTRHLSAVRKNGDIPYLRPDGKSQVTIEYDGDRPVRVEAVVLSTQHDPEIPLEEIRREITERVIDHVIPATMRDERTHIYVNPTGRFVIGGPKGDAGLTGRKIIADTYGGMARHGGGAFSGKDPTKVDRSAAYAARWVAKNVVASGLADRCEVQVAYAIGVAHPVSVFVETFGTAKIPEEKIAQAVRDQFDLRPAAIIHASGSPPSDLPADRIVRPLRASGSRLAVGAHGSCRSASLGYRLQRRTVTCTKLCALALACTLLLSFALRRCQRLQRRSCRRRRSRRERRSRACSTSIWIRRSSRMAISLSCGSSTRRTRPCRARRSSAISPTCAKPRAAARARVGFMLTSIHLSNGSKKSISATVVSKRVVPLNPAAQSASRQQLSPMAGVPYGTVTPGPIAWQMRVGNGPSTVAARLAESRRLCLRDKQRRADRRERRHAGYRPAFGRSDDSVGSSN